MPLRAACRRPLPRIAIVALTCAGLIAIPATGQAAPKTTRVHTPLVFVVGDSYTSRAAGHGLRQEIRAAGGRVIIDAVPGRNLDIAGEGHESGFRAIIRHRRAIHMSDIVILELGTNGDVTRRKLARAFGLIHTFGPHARIYAVNYGATRLGTDDHKRATMRKFNAQNQILRATILAERHRKIFVRGLNWCGQVFGGTFWTCENDLAHERAGVLSRVDGLHPAPDGIGMTAYKNLVVGTVRTYYAGH